MEFNHCFKSIIACKLFDVSPLNAHHDLIDPGSQCWWRVSSVGVGERPEARFSQVAREALLGMDWRWEMGL